MGRHKDIMYSSRTRYNIYMYQPLRAWKKRAYEALMKLPDPILRRTRSASCATNLPIMPKATILHLIYQQKTYEGDATDYDFSAT